MFLLKQLLEKLHEKWNSVKQQPYPAMYSSIFGGIILDPAMMVIPMDDHMVHRGHGVFDTAIILDGYESTLVPENNNIIICELISQSINFMLDSGISGNIMDVYARIILHFMYS